MFRFKTRAFRWLSLAVLSVLAVLGGAPTLAQFAAGSFGSASGTPVAVLNDVGKVSWFTLQRLRLTRVVETVQIEPGGVLNKEVRVARHTIVLFENEDDVNHRLVFFPGPENDLPGRLNSAVIRPGERWGAEMLELGRYPYESSADPDEIAGVVVVVEDED